MDRWVNVGDVFSRLRPIVCRPVPSFVLLVLVYFAVGAFNNPNGYLGADTGAKVYTLETMDRNETTVPDIGYWAEELDPTGSMHPVHQTLQQPNGSWVAVTTLPMLEAAAPLYSWGGYRATLLFPMIAGAFAAAAARSLSRRIDPDTDGWAAFWLVGLASPVFIYALDFWEHTAGVACIVGAISILLGILDGRPVSTALGAGVLLGLGAVMRNEVLVYTLVAVGVTCAVLLTRRRLRAAIANGVFAVAGFAIPWVANIWLESAVQGQSRASRATGTASRVDPAAPSSLHLGQRVEEGLQTFTGLVSGDPALSVMLGGGVLLALFVAVRAERRGDRTFAVVALGAAGIVYAADAIGGLGFVPGMLVAFPVAVGGFFVSGRTQLGKIAVGIAIGALPLVYLFQFLGASGPQWGGRYSLGSAVILGVVGLSGLSTRFPVVGRGLLALTVGVTALGVAWVHVRSQDVAAFFDDVHESAAPVVIARQAFLIREGGSSVVGERWLSVENEDEFADAVRIARAVGESQFTVLEWDGEAPPNASLPDDVTEIERRLIDFIDTPVGVVTYQFDGE